MCGTKEEFTYKHSEGYILRDETMAISPMSHGRKLWVLRDCDKESTFLKLGTYDTLVRRYY